MTDRARLIAERIHNRTYELCRIVEPIRPGPQYWLESDAGPSFCKPCAVKARAAEFDLGPPLDQDSNRWDCRTDLEEAFWEGIDAGNDLHSDSTGHCETCGETLSYILSDYGVDEELTYWLENPLVDFTPEDAYALDRLTLNAFANDNRLRLLGMAAAVRQAWRLVVKHDRGLR